MEVWARAYGVMVRVRVVPGYLYLSIALIRHWLGTCMRGTHCSWSAGRSGCFEGQYVKWLGSGCALGGKGPAFTIRAIARGLIVVL